MKKVNALSLFRIFFFRLAFSECFLFCLHLLLVRKDDSSSSDEETPQDSHTPLIKVSLSFHF